MRALAVSLLVRRLLALVVILFAVSILVFSLLDLSPGSAEQIVVGDRPASAQTIQALRQEYHLNGSFVYRYWEWLQGAVQLDFGRSVRTREPVSSAILEHAGLTAFLGGYAFLITVLFGVPLGVIAALRRRTAVDRGIVGVTVLAVSAPAFASGILLLYLFSVKVTWFPAFGGGSGFIDQVWHLTLPAVALALTALALLVRITRSAMATALEQDFVLFARARGLPAQHVVIRYALRNALVPIVTAAGLILGYMFTGAVLVEVTFGLPGLGNLLINAVATKDIPVIQGIALWAAIAVVVANLLADLSYGLIDPRLHSRRPR